MFPGVCWTMKAFCSLSTSAKIDGVVAAYTATSQWSRAVGLSNAVQPSLTQDVSTGTSISVPVV